MSFFFYESIFQKFHLNQKIGKKKLSCWKSALKIFLFDFENHERKLLKYEQLKILHIYIFGVQVCPWFKCGPLSQLINELNISPVEYDVTIIVRPNYRLTL